MKKFLSMVAALTLVLALAVPAFAAIPSVTYNGSVTTDMEAELNGKNLFIKVEPLTFETAEDKAAFEASLAAAIEELIKGAEVTGEIAVDVTIVDEDGNDAAELFFSEQETLEVLFTVDLGEEELAAVLHQKADGSWESLKFEMVDGKVKVVFSSLSPVVFVTKSAKGEGGDSPKTGDTTGALAITFVALLAGAGYCFISARKAN